MTALSEDLAYMSETSHFCFLRLSQNAILNCSKIEQLFLIGPNLSILEAKIESKIKNRLMLMTFFYKHLAIHLFV